MYNLDIQIYQNSRACTHLPRPIPQNSTTCILDVPLFTTSVLPLDTRLPPPTLLNAGAHLGIGQIARTAPVAGGVLYLTQSL